MLSIKNKSKTKRKNEEEWLSKKDCRKREDTLKWYVTVIYISHQAKCLVVLYTTFMKNDPIESKVEKYQRVHILFFCHDVFTVFFSVNHIFPLCLSQIEIGLTLYLENCTDLLMKKSENHVDGFFCSPIVTIAVWFAVHLPKIWQVVV